MDFFINTAMAQGGAGGGSLTGLLFPLALIAIFYFLLIRPQQKRAKEHRQLVANLAKGDEVLTTCGLVGRINDVGDTYANLELSEGVEVRLQKAAVAQVLPKGSMKGNLEKAEAAGKDDEAGKADKKSK